MNPMNTDRINVLAERIKQRRKQLGLTLDDAVKASGIARASWQGLEHARRANPRATTLRSVETALHWPTGYLTTYVATGHFPDDTPPPPPRHTDTDRIAALERRIDILERLILAQ